MSDAWTARAEREYAAALADFSQPGNRWTAKGRLTYWGKAAGLSAEEIVEDARAHGVTDRDADIRRGWNDATPKTKPDGGGARRRVTPRPRQRPKPPAAFPLFVRDMIRAGGGEAASADLLRLSPVPVPKGGAAQTAAFLSLWDPADRLFVFRESPPSVGRPGVNLMTCADWLERVRRGEALPGDLIKANPLTGGLGKTAGGRDSYVAQSCIARRPFAVVEFDELPLGEQAAFWRGLLTASPLARRVAALVYSGGKSVHGLIRAECASEADWEAFRAALVRTLAADGESRYRADAQALRPGTGVRLAGARRLDGRGRTQNLLYLDPEAAGPLAGGKVLPGGLPHPPGGTIARFCRATADAPVAACGRAATREGNHPAEAAERATGEISGVPRDSAPPPSLAPQTAGGFVPVDDLLAAEEAAETREAWTAAHGA